MKKCPSRHRGRKRGWTEDSTERGSRNCRRKTKPKQLRLVNSLTKKEGRHLCSDRIAEIRHLEAIQRGEKGGVGILVGRRTARNSRKSIGSLPVAGKVSTVKSTGSKRQDRQNPGSETGEGGSLLKGFYYNMTCFIFYILFVTLFYYC